jgi:integrase/recombinase XerD
MIFRRHRSRCSLRRLGRRAWTCACPIWFDGRINGIRILVSMQTVVWGEGQALAQQWMKQGCVTAKSEPVAPPVSEKKDVSLGQACENFLARAKARNLRPATIYKYELLFRQMKEFARKHGLVSLQQFTMDVLEQFQSEWKEGFLSCAKKLERLKSFFRAAHIRRWIDEDPASAMQGPKVTLRPTLPFTREEMAKILAATSIYPDKTGKTGRPNAMRLRAFCLLLRFSGLRIGDAVSLRTEMLDGNKLFLYTSKTGFPVHTRLPDVVSYALRTMPRLSDRYFFWTGNSTLHTAIGIWQRSLRSLFKLAGIENGYAHRFRDTLSVELLLAGVPIEEVSVLLGHSSSKITSKHYSPWVRSRQEKLARSLELAWSQDPLVLLEEEATRRMVIEHERIN